MSMRIIASALYLYVSFALAWTPVSFADERTVERSGSLRSLLPAEQAHRMSEIQPLDAELRWRVRVPPTGGTNGVLVFVNPNASAEPQQGWGAVLDARKLIWVSAVGLGNDKPSAQRVLAALLGLALVQKEYSVDSARIYIAGMSGGGRIASKTITKFPHLFTGAIYIVGVDYWTRAEDPLREGIAANRYVFLTGENDFNRRETRLVYRKYERAGVEGVLLMDLPKFGHEYPNARELDRAIRFLDSSN
jgi:predicted esterase